MSDWPVNVIELGYEDAESSSIIAVATGSGDGVKGSYVELIASTARLSRWININFYPVAGTLHILLDFAIGGAGAEVVKVADMIVGGYAGSAATYSMPLKLNSGVRLSTRAAPSGAAGPYNLKIGVVLLG